MKEYSKNPRQISPKRLARLKDTLERLGDLSGIVHNLTTDEIIGGHQRMKVFESANKIIITDKNKTPDNQGTIGFGYILWKGKKYSYRQVRWNAKTAAEANIVANLGAGEWDWEKIANEWDASDLQTWGMDLDELRTWKRDMVALGLFLETKENDPNAEWTEMPEFKNEPEAFKSIMVHFKKEKDLHAFEKIIKQELTDKTKFIWYPERKRRVLKTTEFK
jgi:hypothetical protein